MNPELPEEIRREVLRASRAAATGRRLAATLAHGDTEAADRIAHEIAAGNDAVYVVMGLAIDCVALARAHYGEQAETWLDQQALVHLDIAEDNERGLSDT